MSAEPRPDGVPVPTFGPRMVCTRVSGVCGKKESAQLYFWPKM
jgi:hypothetical protein